MTLLSVASLFSLPRLAAEHALACKSCHINPNGGGARTEFGNHSVAFNELCLPQTKKLVEEKFKKPRLSESVLFGFDMRYLILEKGRILRMQTDAFVSVEPFESFYYHLRFWENGVNENYALLYFDEQKYYVKFGRFAPAYGLRMDDHKTYVREQLGFGTNFYRDGLSLGAELLGTNFVGEFFNPSTQFVGGIHIFRAGYLNPISYLAGLSVRISETVNGSNGMNPHTRGVFGGISYNRFTLLGELDVAGKGNDSILTYLGLNSRIEYGLYFIAEYNFFDQNKHLSSGVDEFVRLSLELYPLPFVLLRPSYTYYTKGILQDKDDFFLQFHVGY
ncbi:MAG: hypothetical protein ACREBV_00755 [Candidatus Zixiibacteriota bacterium]